MNKPDLIFFDLETTGFDGYTNDLIELYMLKETHDGKFISDLHLFFNIGEDLSDFIENLTGINSNFLSTQPSFVDQRQEIIEFIEPTDILVGHNAYKFDLPFLNKQFIKHGYQNGNIFNNDVRDTMILARQRDNVGPFVKGYKLIDLAYRFQFRIDEAKFHGAKYDVEITKELYKKLIEKY